MFELPDTFGDENEKYVVIPALKNFSKGKFKTEYSDRGSLLKGIVSYASTDNSRAIEVREWIDSVVKEGIKDVYVKETLFNIAARELLSNDEKIKEVLNLKIKSVSVHSLCGNQYSEELKLVKYEINNTCRGKVISIYMCKMIYTYDRKNPTRSLLYPIFIDLYVDKNIITGRAKSKSNMYLYNKDGFNYANPISITTEKEVRDAINLVLSYFNVGVKKASDVNNSFRKKLYLLLDKYTQTPLLIQDMIEDNSDFIESLTNQVIDDVCKIKRGYYEDVKYDITNMIEKYFSISYPDKSIFTSDRDAYPLKINATDEEESRVEQTAPSEEPLQSKAVFFDNKKMMQKSQLCDGVSFVFNRIDPTYFGKSFNVRILTKNDYCLFKFTEYTREDDIDYVLFSIIDSDRRS